MHQDINVSTLIHRLETLVVELADALQTKNWRIATVESCTGGALSAQFTRLPGSSVWFEQAFVTYSDAAKQSMVGVLESDIHAHGAVSETVAEKMAVGGLQRSQANVVVSITGIAGPGGGTKEKPVGTVCFGFAEREKQPITVSQHFLGDRQQVRLQSMVFVIEQQLIQLDRPRF